MQKLEIRNEIYLLSMTYLKYLIIKFRQKISYIAFKKKMTIMELFLNAIKKSYDQLVAEGVIKRTRKEIADEEELYRMVISEASNLTATMSSIMNHHKAKMIKSQGESGK